MDKKIRALGVFAEWMRDPLIDDMRRKIQELEEDVLRLKQIILNVDASVNAMLEQERVRRDAELPSDSDSLSDVTGDSF